MTEEHKYRAARAYKAYDLDYTQDFLPGSLCAMFGLPLSHNQVTILEKSATKPRHYLVEMPRGSSYEAPEWTLTPLRCKNCGKGSTAHADNGKCLYEPTSWEPR